MSGTEAKIVSYTTGERLVVVSNDRSVRTYTRRQRTAEDVSEVVETINGAENIVFSGSEPEAKAVLEGIKAAAERPVDARDTRPRQPQPKTIEFRWAVLIALATFASSVASTLLWTNYVDGSHSRHRLARVAAGPAVKAPDGIRAGAPDGEEEAAAASGEGNARPTGNVSPNGATGAGLGAAATRRNDVGPFSGKQPVIALPPAQPSAGKQADASKGEKQGLEARLKEANEAGQTALADAMKDVEKSGPEAAKKRLEELQNIRDSIASGRKLPAEIVRGLPHELAKSLIESGAVETPEEAAKASPEMEKRLAAIIKLPQEVTERYRDKDGVPTIPESNSWVATGGNVIIPLPGSGEIIKPSDMKLFGLES